MEKTILVINIGSSSKKYSLYKREMLLLSAHFEKDKEKFEVTYNDEETKEIDSSSFEKSLSVFSSTSYDRAILNENEEFYVGLRLVAPGEYFTEDRLIDDTFMQKLSFAAEEDPVHVCGIEDEILAIKKIYPKSIIIAVSDSAFHSTRSSLVKNYALPESLLDEEKIIRFGYHGISLSGIVETLSKRPLGLEKKVIICHLGSGASVTALSDGKSVDTSMGYSPLDGLLMSSRIGDIDVGAVLHLAEKKSTRELQDIFYTKSGLLALSGLSNDMRVLIDAEKEGHTGAHNAIEAFSERIRKYIGAYVAVLGGVDLIVFSGTIGERSFIIRERICSKLEWLHVFLDEEKNTHAKSGDYIGKEGSLGVCVIRSDEDLEIVRKVKFFL